MGIKSLIRAGQSRFPWIRPLKFEFYNFLTRTVGWHIEPEFRLLDRLGPVSLALDVGGNWGQSIEALRYVLPSTNIISYEPNPVLANRLSWKYGNKSTVRIEQFALSNNEGQFNLYIPRYYDFIYDGLASLDEQEASGWFTPERFAGLNRSKLKIECVEVKTFKLDSLGLKPEVVKIDVQGAEPLVISGGRETFSSCRPLTIMEAPSEDLVATMRDFGLNAFHFDGRSLSDWRRYTNNVVFLSEAHREKIGL